jgi:peptidoglycan/LPS O-acetylase OafA/YrhL
MRDISRNLWFDLIRGCSALIVCLGHLRNAILVDYSELVNPSIPIKAFYFMTSLSHQAVMVFFVLSGYFVGGAVLRSGAKFSWRNYLTSRLTRLWVVLIPCLLITWIVGITVEHYSPLVLSGANYDVWHSGPKIDEYSADLSTFLANMFFMQTIKSPVFGLNGPLWSLANEFWYYMLFPLLAIAIGLIKSRKFFLRTVAFIFAMVIIWCLPNDILYGFMVWIMGVAVYLLQTKVKLLNAIKARIFLLAGILLFGLFLGYSRSTSLIQIIPIEPDFAVGFSFAFLCLALTNQTFPITRWPRFASFSLHISEVSYSMYLSHFPIVILIASTIYDSRKAVPDGLVLTQYVGWGLLLMAIGSTVWWLFESRTAFVRDKVNALVNLMLVRK